jgi:hypothetical protein
VNQKIEQQKKNNHVESGIRKYRNKTKTFAPTLNIKKNKNDIEIIKSDNIIKNIYIEKTECKKEPSDKRFFI